MRTHRPIIAILLRPGTALSLVAILIEALAAGPVGAQVQIRGAPAKPAITDEEVARQVKESVAPLYERLPLELAFVAEVCRLNEEQTAALDADCRRAIERLADEAATAMKKLQRFNRVQIVVRAVGAPAVVPWGGAQRPSDWSQAATRSVVSEALRLRSHQQGPQGEVAAWREAADKLAAEGDRLENLRVQASAMAQVAALDETLRLTADQRARLCEQFARHASDASSKSLLVISAGTKGRLYALLACASRTACRLPAADWQRILSADQLATYNATVTPHQEEIHFIARQEALGQIQVQQKLPAKQLRLRAVRKVRQGPNVELLLRLLKNRLQQRIDEVDAACALTDEQRVKLAMAGRLDLERLRAELSPPVKPENGEEITIQTVRVAGDVSQRYDSIFDEEQSCFKKALKGRLSNDQKRELTAAEAERRAFQRQAIVAATIAGFERTATLTSRQWEGLSAALTISIALDDLWPRIQEGQRHWYDDATRVAQLPEKWWRPLFFDFQWPRAGERRAELAAAVRELEMSERQEQLQERAIQIIGGGMF